MQTPSQRTFNIQMFFRRLIWRKILNYAGAKIQQKFLLKMNASKAHPRWLIPFQFPITSTGQRKSQLFAKSIIFFFCFLLLFVYVSFVVLLLFVIWHWRCSRHLTNSNSRDINWKRWAIVCRIRAHRSHIDEWASTPIELVRFSSSKYNRWVVEYWVNGKQMSDTCFSPCNEESFDARFLLFFFFSLNYVTTNSRTIQMPFDSVLLRMNKCLIELRNASRLISSIGWALSRTH